MGRVGTLGVIDAISRDKTPACALLGNADRPYQKIYCPYLPPDIYRHLYPRPFQDITGMELSLFKYNCAHMLTREVYRMLDERFIQY